MNYAVMPAMNAGLNASAGLLLLAGFYFVRQKKITAHKLCMISAFTLSVLFFISYIVYHAHAGTTHFKGAGAVRPVYFSILISHTILAAFTPFLAIATLTMALRKDFTKHKRAARVTFPVWLYVSITGVIIYVMLYVVKYT